MRVVQYSRIMRFLVNCIGITKCPPNPNFSQNSNNFAPYEERDTLWCLLWRTKNLIMREYWICMILGKQTKKIVSRWQLVEPTILSETVPSNSINLRSHQHGQHRKSWKQYSVGRLLSSFFAIWATDRWKGNSNQLSPIRSEIIPAFKKIGRARSGSLIC